MGVDILGEIRKFHPGGSRDGNDYILNDQAL